jgi:BlaI family penicillinase repressor
MRKLRGLSRRERQVMDIVYREGQASVGQVLDGLPDPPSYSAVRATLGILEDKGLLRHQHDGKRFVYVPRVTRDRARQNAIEHLLETFFEGSPTGAVLALLERPDLDLSPEDLERLRSLIARARKEGR